MSDSNQTNHRIALITGGTAGIGYQSALRLASDGFHTIITGRNAKRGTSAVDSIRQATGNKDIQFIPADLSTTQGALNLTKLVKRQLDRLDVLVNNAGAMPAVERQVNDEGIQVSFAVNVLAPYILSDQLLPLLAASPDGQIIQITGGMPHAVAFDPENMEGQDRYVGMMVYSHDKLAMMCLAYDQARRFREQGVRVNVAYPGGAKTPMTTGMKAGLLPWFMRPMFPVMRLMFAVAGNRSAAKASRSTHHLAMLQDGGQTGQYISPKCKTLDWPRPVLKSEVREAVNQYVARALDHARSSTGRPVAA